MNRMRPTTPCPRPRWNAPPPQTCFKRNQKLPPNAQSTNAPRPTSNATGRCSKPTTYRSFNSMLSMPPRASHKMTLQPPNNNSPRRNRMSRSRERLSTRQKQSGALAISPAGIEGAKEQLGSDHRSDVLKIPAQAAVERAKAVWDQARLNLGYTTIRAPISGQVTQLTVHLGQYVLPGNLLFTLVPLDRVYITANFKETQMDHVRPGQRAKIHVDTYDRDFDGFVDSIASAAGSRQALLPPQNATGNFIKVVQRLPVKILVRQSPDSRFVLRPGMNVEASIYTR